MAKRVIEDATLAGIAEAIREKAKTTDSLTPLQMPGAILDIKGAEVEEITNEAGGKSVYINSEVPKMPEGYTRLQWIQSTGEQYINTEYTPNSNTRVLLDAYNLSASSSWTFGAWTSSSSLQFAYSCGSYGFRYGSTNATMDTAPVGSLQIDFNKNAYNRNGTTGTMSEQTFTCEYPLFLFTINAKGTASSGKFTGQVSSCQIYDNGTLVRDYVPCLNASNVAGLYDLVNGVFYGDAAGGSFVAGPVVLEYELPEGYEELEYIQSTGSQYVDTGFKPNNNTRVVMDAQLLSSSAAGFYFGARASGYVDSFGVLFSSSAGALRSAYGSQNLSFATTNYTQKVHIDKNKTSCQLGSETLTHTSATFQNTYNMYLFASNEFGSVGSKAKMSLWGCQIYDNGTLIRYYVPCKNASGATGLWDVVNETFTGDAAGVGFLAGPKKNVVLPEGYTRLQYIQSTGTQYVNTGFKPNQDTRVVIDLQGATTDSGVYGMHYGVKQFMAGKASKNSWNYYVYYGSQEVAYATRTANDFATRHTIDHNKNVITTGGVTQTLSAETFSSSYNMYLFGVNNDGSLGWAGKIRVFACQIYDNDVLVRDYVPCLNESNVAGLYDFVNGVFYGDAAGGAFLAGPEHTVAVSKVVLEDQVLIDLTSDTVTPEALMSGFTAHDAMGQLIQGAASAGKPVASGTFVQSALSQSVTVNGLDFKPNAVFLMWNGINRSQSRSLLAAACKPASSDLGFAAFLYYAYDGSDMFQFGIAGTYFVMNSNGFTCKTTSQQYLLGAYNWIAVG